MSRTGDSRGQRLSLFPASKKKGGIEIKDRKTGHEIRAPCGMEMWITGYVAMENAIHSTWKSQSAAFPRPANSVTHNAICKPVIHIPTTPTKTAKSAPPLSFIHKGIKP